MPFGGRRICVLLMTARRRPGVAALLRFDVDAVGRPRAVCSPPPAGTPFAEPPLCALLMNCVEINHTIKHT